MIKQLFLSLTLLVLLAQAATAQPHEWAAQTGARAVPAATRECSVSRYGAQPGTAQPVTRQVQQAIDASAKAGGGVVFFPKGTYVLGAIFLKTGVHLRIDREVLILGSQSLADYPDMDTRVAGIEMKWPAALINIVGAKNAAVTGEGTIDARGKFNWDLYWKMRKEYDAKNLRWIVDYDVKRVRTVLVQEAENITIKGLTFKNAGFWTVQLLYSKYITVDGVTIRNNEDGSGPSTDGIDVDSSSWVLIDHCDIDCNDDNFCLKAGRDWDGLRVNRPTEYVVIRNSVARRGAGLVTLGSETSGGIRHVLATGLRAAHTDNGLRIKSATTRGGTIEDIYFEDVLMDSVNNAFQFNLNWYPAYSYSTLPAGYTYDNIPAHWKAMLHKVEPASSGIPYARNIYIRNVQATHVKKAFEASGLATSLLANFVFTQTTIRARSMGSITFSENWKMEGLSLSVTEPVADQQKKAIQDTERLQ